MASATPTSTERHLPLAWHGLRGLVMALVHGGWYAAAGSVLQLLAVAALLGARLSADFVAVAFCGVFTVYGFNHLAEAEHDVLGNPGRVRWILARRKAYAWMFGAGAVLVYLLPLALRRAHALGWITALLGLGLLYSLGGKRLTRRVVGFKSVYVGGMYAALVPFLLAYHGTAPPPWTWLVTVLVGLDSAANSTFCDLKDLEADRADRLRTLPLVLGTSATLRVLHAANAVWVGLLVLGVATQGLSPVALFLLPVAAYRAAYLALSHRASSAGVRALAYLVADGEYFLWWGLVLLGAALLGPRGAAGAVPLPWPDLPPLAPVVWHAGSRTPLIADEWAGSLACASIALLLGAVLRYLRAAHERPDAPRTAAHALFAAGVLVVTALTGVNACFATIALSLVAGAVLAGSVRTRVHAVSAVLVAAPCLVFQAPYIEWAPLVALSLAAAADEFALRFAAARVRSPAARLLTEHRIAWKGVLLALTLAAGWPVRYWIAVLAFDAGYAVVHRTVRSRAFAGGTP